MTSCEIGLMMNNGSIWTIKCSYNGYVKDGVGQILYNSYDAVDVLRLFQKGDIAVLTNDPTTTSYLPFGGSVEYASPAEWFSSHRFGPDNIFQFKYLGSLKDTTQYYSNIDEYEKKWNGVDYKYLLRNKDKKEWEVMDINGGGFWYDVEEVLEEEIA